MKSRSSYFITGSCEQREKKKTYFTYKVLKKFFLHKVETFASNIGEKETLGFFIRTFISDLISRVDSTVFTRSGVSLTARFDSLTFFSWTEGKGRGRTDDGERKVQMRQRQPASFQRSPSRRDKHQPTQPTRRPIAASSSSSSSSLRPVEIIPLRQPLMTLQHTRGFFFTSNQAEATPRRPSYFVWKTEKLPAPRTNSGMSQTSSECCFFPNNWVCRQLFHTRGGAVSPGCKWTLLWNGRRRKWCLATILVCS